MNFILTTYIYPIKEPITLSDKLGFYLDNPRNEEEVSMIRNCLEVSLNSPDVMYKYFHEHRIPIKSSKETKGWATVEDSLENLNKNYSILDSYIKKFFELNKNKGPLDLLARMWIVARYNDEGEFLRLEEHIRELSKDGSSGIILLNEGNPIIDNVQNLVGFSYLLSLFVQTDDDFYFGQSFIHHHDSFALRTPKVDRFLNLSVIYFSFMSYSSEIKNREDHWKSFYHIRDSIIETSKKFDSVIDATNQEKILYIANLLKVVRNDLREERSKLVTLVSIIELMLTHNPDHNRFNVEDSISKQFRLKASILIYQNNKSKDLESIKNRLKEIYNQRSNIAHGNFKGFKDYLKKEVKKSKEEDMSEGIVLERLISDLYSFIKAIIEEYIKDRKYVDFLKDN